MRSKVSVLESYFEVLGIRDHVAGAVDQIEGKYDYSDTPKTA